MSGTTATGSEPGKVAGDEAAAGADAADAAQRQAEELVELHTGDVSDDSDDDDEDVPVVDPETGETGGPTKGGTRPEPTRYGDWESGGRCVDF